MTEVTLAVMLMTGAIVLFIGFIGSARTTGRFLSLTPFLKKDARGIAKKCNGLKERIRMMSD